MKKNNPLVNIIINIVIPTLVLTKLSSETYFGPFYGLLIALSFPLVYGLYELIIQKQKNFISILGFSGILLSGGLGLLKFPPHWFAIKEAAIPIIIGIIVLISTKTSWQLVKKFLYNRELLNIDLIESKLQANGELEQLKKRLDLANLFLACSFFFSALLNYFLAIVIIHSTPGTPQFNEEFGRMTMLSFPVIAVPSIVIMIFILRYLLWSIKSLTQLSTNDIFSVNLNGK